jgi:hypothetical protein
MNSDNTMPLATSVRAVSTTLRRPKWFMNAAANGPTRPNRAKRIASAEEISAVSQPNSACSGRMNTPGAPTAPAITSMVRKVTARITQL